MSYQTWTDVTTWLMVIFYAATMSSYFPIILELLLKEQVKLNCDWPVAWLECRGEIQASSDFVFASRYIPFQKLQQKGGCIQLLSHAWFARFLALGQRPWRFRVDAEPSSLYLAATEARWHQVFITWAGTHDEWALSGGAGRRGIYALCFEYACYIWICLNI